MSETTFIYALKEPDTGEIRYVGKADNPKQRLRCHISETKKEEFFCHRTNWIRSLLSSGASPRLEILDEVEVEHWKQWEVAWIEFFQNQGNKLVNGTPGGDGSAHSFEALEKMRIAATGRRCTLETRQKLSLINTGKKQSPETIQKRIEKYSGAKHWLYGKQHSPETCQRVSESLKKFHAKKKGQV